MTSFPSLASLEENLPSGSGWQTPYPSMPTPAQPQPTQTHTYKQYILQFEEWKDKVAQDAALAGSLPVFLGEDYFTRPVQTHTQPSFMAVPQRPCDPTL